MLASPLNVVGSELLRLKVYLPIVFSSFDSYPQGMGLLFITTKRKVWQRKDRGLTALPDQPTICRFSEKKIATLKQFYSLMLHYPFGLYLSGLSFMISQI
jgi:hypothetical protein